MKDKEIKILMNNDKFKTLAQNENDPYKLISNNALERFMFFLNDSIQITDTNYTDTALRTGALIYLSLCNAQKIKSDKSLPKNLTNIIISTITGNKEDKAQTIFAALLEALFEVNTV